jgi:glycosyl transferase family 87
MSQFARNVLSFWGRHCRFILLILMVAMAAAAGWKLGLEFHRLLWDAGPKGAIDLKSLHLWVTSWFAGEPIFQQADAALYPPATYLLLWPLLGWLSLDAARWFWAVTSVCACVAIVVLGWRIAGARTGWERIFVALLLLSINGTGVAIGNGQLILHILPALLAAVLLLDRNHRTWSTDVIVAALLTWTLVKPSVAAPFFWVVLFADKRWRWRPAVLLVLMYAILTVAAAAFQQENLPTLLARCLSKASSATAQFPGTRNVDSLLIAVGWERWITLTATLIFVALGIWTYRYRRADKWLLVAVAAMVARLWTYHRLYDDVLILVPELVLFRIATQNDEKKLLAGVLLGLTAVAMLCPTRYLNQPTEWAVVSDWTCIFAICHTILWIVVLGYLLNYARQLAHESRIADQA